ncbi:A24 family peptidase [Alkalicoccus saliphilus]|uniref:Prepilin peptidase n=1 Tax=Alkalicoccus saliphilus TaxID=200989 RepID=A0A2T4U6X8_9BACI|nr:prepilin peptidase [Alkalicoccus saliphilus]PTL39144.1 prepilin peptidase [Alkalicoccus saliphilus]
MPLFILAILTLLLAVSLITDIASRRILNIVTFPAIAAGFLYHTVTSGIDGFLFSGAGFLVGFGVLLIPFMLGGMGAGDVKLMAAVGALTGMSFTLAAFVLAAFIGGFLALFMVLKRHGVFSSFKTAIYALPFMKGSFQEMRQTAKSTTMPYGVAIVLGTVSAYAGGFGL